MKFGILIFLLAFVISAQGDLQCYVCDNCEDLGDRKPQYCGPPKEDTTTPTPGTTTSAPGTTPTTPTPGTTTFAPATTTFAPATTTFAPGTTTPTPGTTPTTPTPGTTAPTPSTIAPSGNPPALRQRQAALEIDYNCFRITVKGNETSHVNRGCLAIPSGKDGCEFYRDENALTANQTENCRICRDNACNSSAIAQLSGIAILVMLVIQLLQ